MGEVYRARDTRLDRDVALKILPDAFARDPDRLARFEREAKALATLNHPNIAQVHGFEVASLESGARILVMELVEGPTLADRIAQGPIPIDEALPIARQIVDALDAAHAAGIVHRDLKPANIKLRPDGTVKVLDFGLAKAVVPAGGSQDAMADLAHSPTITTPAMTAAGIILGTAAYMSPEQAKARAVDRRTDIWAFGCVLYEMLTGTRLFAADDVSETLAAVLRQELDWTPLPKGTPPAIHRLLRRCLVRDVRQRLPDIGVARLEIDEALAQPAAADAAHGRTARRLAGPILAAGLAGLVLGGGATLGWLRSTPIPEVEPRMLQVTSGERISFPRISPNGRHVVFVRDGRLIVRALDSMVDRVIEGTEGSSTSAWSPDSASIAYFGTGEAGPELRVVSAAGGASRMVTRAVSQGPNKRGPPFAPYGVSSCMGGLLFARWGEGLWLLTEDGPESLVFPLDRQAGDSNFGYPFCLPDGRVLITAVQSNNVIAVMAQDRRVSIATGEQAVVEGRADWMWPILSRTGHVILQRSGENAGIWGIPVNASVTEATGPPKLLLPDGQSPSVSEDGLLVALTGIRLADRELVWVDRKGSKLSVMGRPQTEFEFPTVSPDGNRVAATGSRAGSDGLWIHAEATSRRLADTERANSPAWSPRDDRIVYVARNELIIRSASGGAGTSLHRARNIGRPTWTPDAKSVVFVVDSGTPSASIWMVTIGPDVAPRRLIDGFEPAISPNGRFLAYTSRATGQAQINVTTFPDPGQVWPVSEDAGRHPRWSRTGEELVFACGPQVAEDPNRHRDLCAGSIDGRTGKAGRPAVLFNAEALGYRVTVRGSRGYDVGPDPNRILVQTTGVEGVPTITLIENAAEWIRRAR